MEQLIKISDAAEQLGVSSRTMRYYEEIGLITSIRPQYETYRFYDDKNMERVRQICILRKMQISIKDIKRIFEAQDIQVVVETFFKSISEIDLKITSLEELRMITNEFVSAMLESGISHIDALPVLYERIQSTMNQAQEEALSEKEAKTYEKLKNAANAVKEQGDPDVVQLPAMRMWSSVSRKTGVSDPDLFYEWLSMMGLYQAVHPQQEIFEYQSQTGETVILARKTMDLSEEPFEEERFEGGLFAVGSVYLEDDIQDYTDWLIDLLQDTPYYQLDYGKEGAFRCPILAEEIHSIDRQREKVMLYLPIKRRHPDASYYEPFTQVKDITPMVLEQNNPVLWSKQVILNDLSPIMNPYYRVNEQGEAEYIPYIDVRRLSTKIQVSLPFRVDVEVKIQPEAEQFRYGADEGSIRFYYGMTQFGINMENNSESALSQHAIAFQEPVFGDWYRFPGIGEITMGEYHHVSWIVGKKELAVIIDGEVRFCGTNFPYMKTDFREEPAQEIVIGSNGQSKLTVRNITVSQLKRSAKRILKGDYIMNLHRNNNIIPIIHALITKNKGENYWFNGAASYVMEAKGETELDYNFWAGLTGDVFTQTYSKQNFLGDGCSEYFLDTDTGKAWIEDIFEKAGYSATFVLFKEIQKNKEMYLQTLKAYIDQGIPVLWKRNDYTVWNVFVGYEEDGKTLLFLTDEMTEPAKVSSEEAMDYSMNLPKNCAGWIFVGGKSKEADLKTVYREAVLNLPQLFAKESEKYCLGGNAFRAWAETVESDWFQNLKPEEFDDWAMYKSYVCCAATNSSCCYAFLAKAHELNPDLSCIDTLVIEYRKMKTLWDELEGLGGGFGVSLETLKNPEQAKSIAAKIREFGVCADKIEKAVLDQRK